VKLKLHTKIFIGMFLGALFGYFFKDYTLAFCPYIGDVFIRMLMMLIVPLVFASMVVGIGSVGDITSIGKIGLKTLLYFMLTTMVSVTIGLILVAVTKPGLGTKLVLTKATSFADKVPDSLIGTLVKIVPKNIFQSLTNGEMLSIILFSLLIGAALTTLGTKGKNLYSIFETINDVMMKITDWVMAFAPYGVFALIASTVAQTGLAAFRPLTVYLITILIGLAIQAIIVLPLILRVLGKYSPLKLFKEVVPALATVFSTASSAAAMPLTIDCLLKKTGVSKRVVGFMIPLGTTMNMNGTALFQGVAVIFFAQIYGIEITLIQQAIIIFTATLAAVAAAGIPSAGFITMVIIMNAVGVPIEGIGFILGVDRFLDMFRSSVNVWSNATGAVVVSKLEGEALNPEIETA
jgi:proton glutamate symport protein